MTSVLIVDDSLRNDIHNGMIMIATTLGLVATSFLGAGVFFFVKAVRRCPPCVPYEATCSTACVGCPTTCTTVCYSCQSGKTKSSSLNSADSAEVTAPAEVTVQIT